MKTTIRALALCVLISFDLVVARAQPTGAATPAASRYGSSAEHGHYLTVNGIKLYYEIHGTGPDLLMMHGNGGSIVDLAAQIGHFSKTHRVIVPDSRGHGKSEFGKEPLTYERMAEDINALLNHLRAKSVAVLGFSDGAILGLLLAIHHPDKVGKLVAAGGNLHPSAAYDWALRWAEREVAKIDQAIKQGDKSPALDQQRQKLYLLLKQPNIPITSLKMLSAPTLVIAGDRDVLRPEHTQAIFEALPNAHLAILPGTTHFTASDDPEIFNRLVERFLSRPFTRPQTSDIIR